MSQGLLAIPTAGTLSGISLVNGINAALDRIVSNSSGSVDPATITGGVQPFSFWLDTGVSPNVLRIRNAANTAWAAVGTITANNFVPDISNVDIATALGFTPLNKAGDTMSGDLTVPNLMAQTIRPSTKIVFPDGSEQSSAAKTEFPSGTSMLFVQSSAPTGWTKSTAHNDKALRVVSGSVSSGGSVAFSTAFSSKSVTGSVGATTLSTTQIPSHAHSYTAPGPLGANPFDYGTYMSVGTSATTTGAQGGGGSHNHSFTGDAINMAVQYVDVIICTKN